MAFSRREGIAALAMQGIITWGIISPNDVPEGSTREEVTAKWAVEYADALLKALADSDEKIERDSFGR